MSRETDYTLEHYTEDFRTSYEREPYFKVGQSWDDYEPAYRYGYDRYTGDLRGRDWEQVEGDMHSGWEQAKSRSRLAWEDAKHAVKAGWHRLERALPGDADHDGR